MMNRFALSFFAFLLVGVPSLQAQGMGPQTGQHQILSTDGIIRIPFELEGNHIFLMAKLNDKVHLRLILDTGMPMPGLSMMRTPALDEADLHIVAEMPMGAPGGAEPIMVEVADGIKLEFPGLELTEVSGFVEPYDSVMVAALGNGGVIGYELFSQFVVTVDYEENEIILVEPEKFRAPENAHELPFVLRNGMPWLECSAEMVNGTLVPMELVVDLGAYHAVSLNVGAREGLNLPDETVEAYLGRTMSGPIYGHVGRIKALNLGQFALKHVIASFQTGPRHGPSAMEKEGNLGCGALRRFHVTFDYSGKRMLLVPNAYFGESFEYNMSGIEYTRTPDKHLSISAILPGSPAADAGLKEGSFVTQINSRAMVDVTKDELRALLRQEGSKITLLVSEADGAEKEVSLTLRRII